MQRGQISFMLDRRMSRRRKTVPSRPRRSQGCVDADVRKPEFREANESETDDVLTALEGFAMRLAYLGIVGTLLVAGPAFAADASIPDPEPQTIAAENLEARWQFGGAAYLWAPSIHGTSGFKGLPPIDVDASFSDILDNLDVAFMGVAEAGYDRYGIFTDLIYTKMSASGTGPYGIARFSVENEMLVASLMGEYRLLQQDKSTLDVMAGGRLWYVGVDIDVTVPNAPIGYPAGASFSDDEIWVDPMLGIKGRLQGNSPWYVTGWGMVGGFGVSSDFAWDAFGGVGYELNHRWSFVAGYRGLGVDYSNDGFVFDVVQHGPIFGAVLHF
ncbi:hypothetical protein [Mesorhizobium marinum]|uniref:hypothetical protein n=1 Tax=Mesorhizobium marinum TaxID=3228790 RepID=UPI003465C181